MNIKEPGEALAALHAQTVQALLALSGIAATLGEAGSVARALTRLAPPAHGR